MTSLDWIFFLLKSMVGLGHNNVKSKMAAIIIVSRLVLESNIIPLFNAIL